MPGASGKCQYRECHANIQRTRHGNAPRHGARRPNPDQITRQVKRTEQSCLCTIHPASRDHGGKQRHIGEAREADPRAGCRRAGERGEGRALHPSNSGRRASHPAACS